jgi:hypothetical protein
VSLIGARLSLTHRCMIERAANTASLDEWGAPDPADWQPHLSDQPCRTWATAGREAVTDTTTLVVAEDIRLILPVDADVTEQDRVVSVTSRSVTIQEGPLSIRAVLQRRDHLELVLVRIA